jgi:hypothetical protein
LPVERGVVPAVAARLCGDDSPEQRTRLARAIRYLDAEVAAGKRFANPGGFLVSLVGRGVPADRDDRMPGSRSREPMAHVAAAAKPKAEPYELEYAYQTYLDEVGVQSLGKLDERALERRIAMKRKELLTSPKQKTFRNMPSNAFEEHVLYMVRKDLAVENAVPFDLWVAEGKRGA